MVTLLYIAAWMASYWFDEDKDSRITKLCSSFLKVLTVVAFFLVYGSFVHQQKSSDRIDSLTVELKEERACEKSPICMDGRARQESVYASDKPYQSRTGRIFFRGIMCNDECDTVMKGYTWAEQLGVTKRQACGRPNPSFTTGCLLYVEPFDGYTDTEDYGYEPD